MTPRVALTAVLPRPAKAANLKTSRGRSKAWSPPANRSTSQAPTSPSTVFPVAMPRDVPAVPTVVRLTRKAPAKMPGHTRRPSRRKAARVRPVVGHTGLALAWRKASFNPSLPRTM